MSTAVRSSPSAWLYAADMAKRKLLTAAETRRRFSERVARLISTGENPPVEHTVIALRGKPVGVLVDIEWYRRMAEADGDPTEF